MTQLIDEIARSRIAALERHLGYISHLETTDLTFGDALVWLKIGKKVGRWHRNTIYVYLLTPGKPMLSEFRVHTINGDDTVWCPNHAELLATDWRVIEE